jgi:hypothetical protein
MRNKLILASALTLALASTTGALAQTDKYDGGDHMYSYAPMQPAAAPTRTRAARHNPNPEQSQVTPAQSQSNVQYDSTGDHMHSFGPASK